MTKLPAKFTTFSVQLLYALLVPVFFLLFIFVYRPMRVVDFMAMGADRLVFNVTILTCILFGVVFISRMLLFVVRGRMELNVLEFVGWHAGELVASSLFSALYMTLMYHGEYNYYTVAGWCFGWLLLIFVYPYIILGFSLGWSVAAEHEDSVDDSLMRFVDATKRLRLIVSPKAVLYVESRENYVLIRYVDGDKMKEYSLRASMLSLEPLMEKHAFVRCQRSYYINPLHVKALRSDKQGSITAELDVPDTKPIPVSPKYYQMLAEKL